MNVAARACCANPLCAQGIQHEKASDISEDDAMLSTLALLLPLHRDTGGRTHCACREYIVVGIMVVGPGGNLGDASDIVKEAFLRPRRSG